MKKIRIFLCCLACLFLGAIITMKAGMDYIGKEGLMILQAHLIIDKYYVGDYSKTDYTDKVLDSMVSALGDEWSYYMSKDTFTQAQTIRSNTYWGTGMKAGYVDGVGLQVSAVVENSPAAVANIIIGDVISAIDGVGVTPDNCLDLVATIKDSDKTQVTLTIVSADGTERIVTVACASIHEKATKSELLDGDIGYLSIANFYEDTGDEAVRAINKLLSAGADSLILDVRNNPGGYMDEMVILLDRLMPAGTVCICQSVDGAQTSYPSDDTCVTVPISIIVNESSYSAAEFLAAELQESMGASVVGAPTSGKGFAQTTFQLDGGSAMGLSTMKYYTSQGTSLIGKGVTLDVEEYDPDLQLQAAVDSLG